MKNINKYIPWPRQVRKVYLSCGTPLYSKYIGVHARRDKTPVRLPGVSEFLCRTSRSPWQLAHWASTVKPETLKRYTFSDFTLRYFELIRRQLPFVGHSKGKMTLQLAPGTSWKCLFCHALEKDHRGYENEHRGYEKDHQFTKRNTEVSKRNTEVSRRNTEVSKRNIKLRKGTPRLRKGTPSYEKEHRGYEKEHRGYEKEHQVTKRNTEVTKKNTKLRKGTLRLRKGTPRFRKGTPSYEKEHRGYEKEHRG